jgi:hypothetical protein
MATTLFDITKSVARYMGLTKFGVATGGTTSTLVDTDALLQPGQFNNGTIWFHTGNLAGKYLRITSAGGDTVTFATQTLAVVAGVKYTICDPVLPLSQIISAINQVLVAYPIQKRDDSHIVVDTTSPMYELSGTGFDIRDVLRVEVEEGDAGSELWVTNQMWTEDPVNQHLNIYGGLGSTDDGAKLRITYRANHGEVLAYNDAIDPQIDLDFLMYSSVVNIYRQIVQVTKKDDSTAFDLFNEAKMLEAQSKSKRRKAGHLQRDIRLAIP